MSHSEKILFVFLMLKNIFYTYCVLTVKNTENNKTGCMYPYNVMKPQNSIMRQDFTLKCPVSVHVVPCTRGFTFT